MDTFINCSAPALGLATLDLAAYHLDLVPLGAAPAVAAGLSPPHRDEAPAGGAAQGFQADSESDRTNCPNSVDAEQAIRETKRRANLAAALTLRGFELQTTNEGTFIVSRWNLSRELSDLSAVYAFAERVGAKV